MSATAHSANMVYAGLLEDGAEDVSRKTWFYHWIPLNLIAKTASPGPGVSVPTLESWNFFEFSCVFHVFDFSLGPVKD